MSQTYQFPANVAFTRKPRQRVKRPVGNKFQEIARRSPKDMAAFDVMADLVLARLNEEDRKRSH